MREKFEKVYQRIIQHAIYGEFDLHDLNEHFPNTEILEDCMYYNNYCNLIIKPDRNIKYLMWREFDDYVTNINSEKISLSEFLYRNNNIDEVLILRLDILGLKQL